MIVYRCDSCNTNVDTQEDLTSLTVQVKMGGIFLVNLPPIDRCHKCNESMKNILQTLVREVDDTRTHNTRTQPTIDPARLDALHVLEEGWTPPVLLDKEAQEVELIDRIERDI